MKACQQFEHFLAFSARQGSRRTKQMAFFTVIVLRKGKLPIDTFIDQEKPIIFEKRQPQNWELSNIETILLFFAQLG